MIKIMSGVAKIARIVGFSCKSVGTPSKQKALAEKIKPWIEETIKKEGTNVFSTSYFGKSTKSAAELAGRIIAKK